MKILIRQLRTVLLYVVIGGCIPINIGASAETSILGNPVDHLPEENGFRFVDVSAFSSGKGVWVLTKVLQGSQIFQTHTLELWRLDVDGKTELKLDLRPYLDNDVFQNVDNSVIASRSDGGVIIVIPLGAEIFEYGFSFDGELDYERVLERPAFSGRLKSIEILSPSEYLLVFMDNIIFRNSETEKTTIWEPEQYSILDSLIDRNGQITLLLIDPTKTMSPLVLAKFDANKKELSNQFEMNVWSGPIFGIKLIRDVNNGSAIVMAGKEDAPQFQIARFDSRLQLLDVLLVDKIPFEKIARYDALVLEQDLILFVTLRSTKSQPIKNLWLGLFSGSGELLFEEEDSSQAFNYEVIGSLKLAYSMDSQSIALISNMSGTNDPVNEEPQSFLRSHSFQVDDVLTALRSSR